jgi:hypothetical protein
MNVTSKKLNDENYHSNVLRFRDRQAGVSVVYDAELDRYFYNSYCIETKLLKELYSCEHEQLEDALSLINDEFGSWDIESLAGGGCGSCVAK